MAEDIRSMRIELSMHDMGVERTVGQIKQAFRTMKSEVSNATRMFDRAEKSTSDYWYQLKNLKTAQANYKNELKAATRQEAKMVEQHGQNSTQALKASEAVAQLKEQIDYTGRQIKTTTSEMEQFKVAQRVDRTPWAKMGKNIQGIGSQLGTISQKTGQVGMSLTKNITRPAGIAAAAVGGIALAKGWARLVEIDNAKAKLSALGNSGKQVETIMTNANTAVKGTSFGMGEAATTAANAVAAGIKPGKELTQYLTNTGDAAAIAGVGMDEMGRILNKVQTSNKAYNGELQELSDRGLPVYQWLAKEAGIAESEVADFAASGQVTSKMLQDAIENNIGGAAKKMGEKSFTASLANMWAALGRVGAGFLDAGGKGGGFFSKMKPIMNNLTTMFDGMQGTAERWGVALGASLNAVLSAGVKVKQFYDGLPGPIQSIIKSTMLWGSLTLVAIGPMLLAFSKLTGALSMVFGPFGTFLTTIGKVAVASKNAGGIIAGITTLFPKLGAALTLATGPVGLTIAAIVALGAAFVIAYKKSETFRNIVNGAVSGVVAAFKWLWSGIMTVLTPVGNAIASFGRQLAKTFGQFWAENGPQFMQALNNIKTGFMVVWSIIRPIISGIGSLIKIVFGGILSFIKFIMPAIQGIFKIGWAVIKYIFVSTWEAIKGVVNGGLKVIMGIIQVFSGLFTGNFKLMWSGIKNIFFGALQFVWNLVQLWFVGKIFGVFKLGLKLIKSIVSGSLGSVKGTFTSVLGSIWGIVKKIFGWISSFMRNIFGSIWKFTKAVWSNIKLAITNPVGFINKWVTSKFRGLSGAVKVIFSGLKKAVSIIWSTLKTVVVNTAKAMSNLLRGNFSGMRKNLQNITNALKNAVIKLWRNLKNTVINVAKSLWNGVKDKFNALKKSATDITQKLKNTVKDKWEALKKNVVNLATGAKDGVVKGFKAMYNKGVEWLDKLKGFIKGAKDGFKKVATSLGKGVANGAIAGLNAMIDGINALSDKIMKKKLIKKKIPKLSTGTGASPSVQTDSQGRLKHSTKAVVNDKGIGNAKGPGGHKEIIQRRNGKMIQPKGRNKVVRLRRGDAVHNGMQSKSLRPHLSTGTGADLLKQAKKRHKHEEPHGDMYVPKNSGNAGGNIATDSWEWMKDKAKKAKDSFSKTFGDVMDYVTNPGKLVSKVMKHFGVDFSSIKGAMGGVMDFGYSGLKNGLKDLVTGWFDEVEGGDGDGGYIDLSRGINFGFARTAAEAAAQGYPFPRAHHGLDINYPYGTTVQSTVSGKATGSHGWNGGFGNMMSIKSGIMEVIYGHLSKLNWTGTKSVKPGTVLGKSGGDPSRQGVGAGSSTGPHLHYEMRKNGVPFDPTNWLKKNNGGGKAGGKYGSTIKQALGMAGLPQTAQYIKAWQSQAKTESTFNPRAKNPSGASGLVQVKPATFNAFKLPGHGNIWNPLDNLIAGMRYAKATYGPKGMLNQIGHGLPYKTGGVINENGMYNLAEDGHSEVVVPLDPARASDAMKLITYAQSKVKDKKNKKPSQMGKISSNSDNEMVNFMARQLEATQKQVELLTQLVASNQRLEQKPTGVSENDMSRAQGKRAQMMAYNMGGAF
ncbi:peptidoglycan DD-metalloendopeptidase family protein [Staphylococcus pseudoxylosus]|uniref:peptidoglycan DD-metalloendopeptidase family protein n=1 Tax=Staphylococcus pseudoxylosus TaxID=2282419 RepID=UPI002DBFC067|nr:peptidoglycan DD-metalloendopeptidase family protein [Staphylococcus pseudoxylosus]MEB8088263.1 peptidoglycan DD-metalloendopeptidase family protein [Staphylococcus pseudoxylosus]